MIPEQRSSSLSLHTLERAVPAAVASSLTLKRLGHLPGHSVHYTYCRQQRYACNYGTKAPSPRRRLPDDLGWPALYKTPMNFHALARCPGIMHQPFQSLSASLSSPPLTCREPVEAAGHGKRGRLTTHMTAAYQIRVVDLIASNSIIAAIMAKKALACASDILGASGPSLKANIIKEL